MFTFINVYSSDVPDSGSGVHTNSRFPSSTVSGQSGQGLHGWQSWSQTWRLSPRGKFMPLSKLYLPTALRSEAAKVMFWQVYVILFTWGGCIQDAPPHPAAAWMHLPGCTPLPAAAEDRWSTSGQYGSYWNAFLFNLCLFFLSVAIFIICYLSSSKQKVWILPVVQNQLSLLCGSTVKQCRYWTFPLIFMTLNKAKINACVKF